MRKDEDGSAIRAYETGDLYVIENGLRQLKTKYQQSPTKELAWEIKLYEWILKNPEPGRRSQEYLETRFSSEAPLTKRETVYRLGWLIV